MTAALLFTVPLLAALWVACRALVTHLRKSLDKE